MSVINLQGINAYSVKVNEHKIINVYSIELC